MKSKLLAGLCLLVTNSIVAQDLNIGPADNVNVLGNLVVKPAFVKSNGKPTTTFTMPSNGGVNYTPPDSVGRIRDHVAPPALYFQNRNSLVAFAGGSNFTSIEITFEYLGLGDGDSLIIFNERSDLLLRAGTGFVPAATYTFNATGLWIQFKSNADLSLGIGFSLVWRRLYNANNIPAPLPVGNSFVFNRSNGSLGTGLLFPEPMGSYSTVHGQFNRATGEGAFASGYGNVATGSNSMAVGLGNDALNAYSFALGTSNTSSGYQAFSLGANNTASGGNSIALGRGLVASGVGSLATGQSTTASGNVSTTAGLGTLSASFACFSIGRYNYTTPTSGTQWIASDPVFIVGNGISPSIRSNIMEFYKNGNLLIWGTLYQFSDEKLKRDIKPLENSLEKLSKLNGYNYFWADKNVDDRLQTGMLAQEIKEIFPELVTKNQKGEESVNYIGLIPHLIEAIKELKSESKQADIAVCLCDDSSPEKLSAFPNPAVNRMTLTVTTQTSGKGILQLFDANGKMVKQVNISIQKGKNTISLSLPELAAGNYELVASWGQGMKRQVSIVKQ